MQNVGSFELRGLISDSLLIDKQREGNARFLPEEIGIPSIAQAYGCKLSACVREIALIVAQLRNVLAAENSPVMAQKNENSGTSLP